MNQLQNLKPDPSQSKKSKRRGRGNGSGHGTYSTKGGKGQTARSGGQRRPGFEGGQTPLYRKMPKLRGFMNPNSVRFVAINIESIEKKFGDKSKISKNDLIEFGIIKSSENIKLLAKGQITKAFEIEVDAASKKAIEAVEKAGGKVSIIKKRELTKKENA